MSFWPLCVLMLVIFIVMVVVLRYVLGRHYLMATTHLQSLAAEYSRRHDELKQQLGEAERHYEEQMSRAQAEAERLIAQARQEADSSRAKILEEARLESERIVQQGMESRDALRKEIEQTMDDRAIQRACELIQVALPESLRREIQSRWIDEVVQNGASQLERLKTDEPVRDATLASAFPLSPEQRRALQEWLKKGLGHDLTVTEETDERLVAGLKLTVGSRVLDASLFSRVQQAARHAQSTA